MTTILIVPQIAFGAYYEDDIKNTIFNAMDCKLESNRRFNHETRWFKDFPEFILTASPSFNNKDIIEISRNYGKWFDMSIERINKLYDLIYHLFPNGTFVSRYKSTYNITINQIFRLGTNVWVDPKGHSVFYCEPPIMPIEYNAWIEAVTHHDFTYMMSDSPGTYKAGVQAEERIKELKKNLDHRVCTLWYNYILGRANPCPQEMSFGDQNKSVWNTISEAYKEFRIMPSHHPYVELGIEPTNKPCIGFTAHAKRIGWFKDDMKYEGYVSNNYFITKEEYDNSITPTDIYLNYTDKGILYSKKEITNKHDITQLLERSPWWEEGEQYYTLKPEGILK